MHNVWRLYLLIEFSIECLLMECLLLIDNTTTRSSNRVTQLNNAGSARDVVVIRGHGLKGVIFLLFLELNRDHLMTNLLVCHYDTSFSVAVKVIFKVLMLLQLVHHFNFVSMTCVQFMERVAHYFR